MATFCTASEPRIVSGTRGQYRVVEIPNISHPFELTDDLKFAVVQYDGGFYVQSAIDGQRIGKNLQHAHSHWKVVDSRLLVANDNGWEVFSLPELQEMAKIPGPPPLPGVDRKVAPTALARGWYCHGLFYDDAATKVVASCRIPSARGWITGVEDLRLYDVSVPISVMPFEIQAMSHHVVLHQYDRVPVAPPTQPSIRYGLRWMTMHGKASFNFSPVSQHSGLYIELVDHDFSKVDLGRLGRQTLVGWNTPSLLLDPNANFADWKMLVLPTDTLSDAKLIIYPRDTGPVNLSEMISGLQPMLNVDPQAIPENARNLDSNSLVNELQNAEYAEVDEVIDRYLVTAVPEFELVTGQNPKHIPVAFNLRFENADSFTQVIWADMTRAEVLSRFGKSVWKRETDRLLDEQKEAIAAHEQKIIQTNAANESTRAATIARKSAWITNSIYLSLCVIFFSGSLGSLYFIKHLRTRLPQPSDQPPLSDQPLVFDQPPVVQP